MTTKCTKWEQNIPNGGKIERMAIKYTNIVNWKTLQNLPKLGFWVWKCTIWQPWRREVSNDSEKGFLKVGKVNSRLSENVCALLFEVEQKFVFLRSFLNPTSPTYMSVVFYKHMYVCRYVCRHTFNYFHFMLPPYFQLSTIYVYFFFLGLTVFA
jgi:hypothetical protein